MDEIGSGSERTTDLNVILNTLDGVQTKGNDIIVIFTTNHENRINPALRRPGRLDLIVKFGLCEDDTKKKIYMALMKDVPGYDDVDFDEVVENTEDVQGAVIAEICKRGKKLALRDGAINTDRMLAAIASMKYQIEFMAEAINEETDEKKFVNALQKVISGALKSDLEEITETVDQVNSKL